jgi:hypothetical protein
LVSHLCTRQTRREEKRFKIILEALFGNFLTAFGAISVFAVFNASERRVDALQVASPRALRRLRHRLLLHGVHAR